MSRDGDDPRVTTSKTPPVRLVVLIDVVTDSGGAEILAVELLRRLDPRRFRRTLVIYRYLPPAHPNRPGQDAVVRQLRSEGVEVIELDAVSRRDLLSWRPLLRRLHRGEVDVLHSHKHGPNLWGAVLSRVAAPGVLIAHEHTWSFEGDPLRVLTDRWLIAPTADLMLAVSEQDRDKMIDLEGMDPGHVRVLPNGIRPVPPAPAASLREEFGIPEGSALIGSVGVLREQKDFPGMVEAHRMVLARHPDAHLVIIGGGRVRPELERLIAQHGLADRVHLAGSRPGGPALAREFDIAVNSSTFEGSSLAILEYMATARPIVATAVGGTSELLAGGAAGVLVPPSRPDLLAEQIGALIEDPERATRLGAAAATRQREHFDIDRQVERLEQLYLELHTASPAGRRGRSRRGA